jgi:hypothetical protein
MKTRLFLVTIILTALSFAVKAQTPAASVPLTVRSELARRYPDAKNPVWNKTGGNYEANFTSKADGPNMAIFTTFGAFVGLLTPTPIKFLPPSIAQYVKSHAQSSITDAHKNVSVMGKITYRIKIKSGKILIFDQDGKCLSR